MPTTSWTRSFPFVDREFRTLATREHRGCFGKSSGGYGAMMHGMKYTAHWGAIANHSGDAYFDFLYRADWPNTLNELAKYRRPALKAGAISAPRDTVAERALRQGRDDGRVRRFLESVWSRPKLTHAETHAIMNVCMAATYDPDPAAPLGFRLPFHLDTGELLEQRWQRWLANDPALLVKRHARNLRRLKGIYIDCGWRDQYQIHFGTRQLSRRLAEAGIEHRYEEFDDTHSDVDYRMDVSLPFLYRALRPCRGRGSARARRRGARLPLGDIRALKNGPRPWFMTGNRGSRASVACAPRSRAHGRLSLVLAPIMR